MRQMHKVGLLLRLLLNPVERVISKFVGNVALLRYMLPVDIQSVFLGQVRSLTFKTHPMIESGLGIVARIPHVPLTEKRRLIAGLLQITRIKNCALRDRRVVIHNPVLVRILSRENGSAAWRAERRRYKCVLQINAAARHRIHMRSFQERLRLQKAERIVAVVVRQHHNHVAWFASGFLLGASQLQRRSRTSQQRFSPVDLHGISFLADG